MSSVLSAQRWHPTGRQKPVWGTHDRTRCLRKPLRSADRSGSVSVPAEFRAAEPNSRSEGERGCGRGGPWVWCGHFSLETPLDGLPSVRSSWELPTLKPQLFFDTLSSILQSSPNLAKSPFEMLTAARWFLSSVQTLAGSCSGDCSAPLRSPCPRSPCPVCAASRGLGSCF